MYSHGHTADEFSAPIRKLCRSIVWGSEVHRILTRETTPRRDDNIKVDLKSLLTCNCVDWIYLP